MARARTKADLIASAGGQWDKLWELIGGMDQGARTATFDFGDYAGKREAHWRRDKNLRDVLVHLYEWHRLILNWVEANQKGENRPFLPPPYNWKNYGQMNEAFWAKHQDTSPEQAEAMLRESHAQVMALLDGFSNEELFERGRFKWTGTTTLGSYFVSATASHYDWAMKKLKAPLRSYQ